MSNLDFIIALFVFVDDRMTGIPSHSQEKLAPSELVTLGLLFALKGVSQSAFYRWITFNWRHLFPNLPHRTRLFKRIAARQDWTELFLAEMGLRGIADTFASELRHPMREKRSRKLVGRQGKKGLSNHRWVVGVKSGILVNHLGRIADWSWDDANVHDTTFRPLIARHSQSVVYVDNNFHGKKGDPSNMKVCKRGQNNFRFLVETVFSLLTRFLCLKKIGERTYWFVQARLSFAVAACNIVLDLFAPPLEEAGRVPLRMPQICL